MQGPLHTGRLVLTPTDPYWLPADLTGILHLMQAIGFIGASLNGTDRRYLLGDNFMQLVSFMGCSPHIRLQPAEPGQDFCHLVVDGPTESPRLLCGDNTTPPRCEACRKRLTAWRPLFDKWRYRPDWRAPCPHCGHRQDPATYDFRQSAGCGRLFFFIENIFPQEAIPSPTLLEHLQRVSGQAWRYFYLQCAGS